MNLTSSRVRARTLMTGITTTLRAKRTSNFKITALGVFLFLYGIVVVRTYRVYSRSTYGNGWDNLKAKNDSRMRRRKNKKSYFLYFAKEGWANQEQCLKNAYFLAMATNRILILPPVLPHANSGLVLHERVLDKWYKKKGEIPTTADIINFYVETVPEESYIPLGDVIDLEYTLPNVTSIEFRDFYRDMWVNFHNENPLMQQTHQIDPTTNGLSGNNTNATKFPVIQKTNRNLTDWVMENVHFHSNTLWIQDRPELEDRSVFIKYPNKFWAGHWPLNESFMRPDIARMADESMVGRHDIWTFLDAFEAMIDESLLYPDNVTYFEFRYSSKIRQAARRIRENVWGGMPYASVHIRAGGDDAYGCFLEKDVTTTAIYFGMNEILSQIKDWFDNKDIDDHPSDIGIFIATDSLHDLLISNRWPAMEAKRVEIEHTIRVTYNATVHFLDGRSTKEEAKALKSTVGYPGIFLDQQLAACGEIGFIGTDSLGCFSTFSRLISNIRDSPDAC